MKKPVVLVGMIVLSAILGLSTKSFAYPHEITSSSNRRTYPDLGNASAIFSQLHLAQAGMKSSIFNAAIRGFGKLLHGGELQRDDIITVIDFSQPSNKKRLYVIDLENRQILFNTLVAHGRNSGRLWAHSFSNNPSSLKSSPGFYVTGEAYFGDNGYSLKLDGMEETINDNARSRGIVVHGAPYVDESTINSLGFLGRSWGCPAVPLTCHEAIINTIKDGTCLFIYSPAKNYLRRSILLRS